jgi:hypothetical protein
MSTLVESESLGTGVTAHRDPALTRAEWCLRVGAAACFLGHGAFGILTKEAWVSYFAVVGIGSDAAYALMPIVGSVDVVMATLVLLSPRPVVLLYMVIWGTWTAFLRPLAGESFFETVERAGNYGVPLALALGFFSVPTWRTLLAPVRRRAAPDRALIGRVLLWTTAALLFAHGALQVINRNPAFTTLYAAIDLPGSIAPVVGIVEMVAAVLALVAPVPAFLIAIAVWKLATESLFPLSGLPIWEFVERAGSYTAPNALVLLSGKSPFTRINLSRSSQ